MAIKDGFESRLAELSTRIRDAMSRGPLARLQRGFVGTDAGEEVPTQSGQPSSRASGVLPQIRRALNNIETLSDRPPVEPVSAPVEPVKPFEAVRRANERIQDMVPAPLAADPVGGEVESVVGGAPAPQSGTASLSPLEILRKAQKENVERGVLSRAAAPVLSSPPQTPLPASVAPAAAQKPALHELLDRMDRREFCRVVQDTLTFDRARSGAGTGYDFVAAEARTSERNGQEVQPSSFADQSALRSIVRDAASRLGIEKTEETLRALLFIRDTHERQTLERAAQTGNGGSASAPSSLTDEQVQTLADKHLRATMAPDWTPDRETPENVALVNKEIDNQAREDYKNANKAIKAMHALEQKLMGMEIEDPSLFLKAGAEPREEWGPKAHEFRAKLDRSAGSLVDEDALRATREESRIHKVWRAFMRATMGKQEEPKEPVSILREVEPASTPSVPSGKIRQVRGGVYELTQG